MGTTFSTTATYSNLTRLELEQLRRADFWTGGKALTVGDAAYGSEGVVGKGDVNAEPYFTGPELPLDAVFMNTPPSMPGPGLATTTQIGGLLSETVSWVGPESIYDSNVGYCDDPAYWKDDTPGLNFTLWVHQGDVLLIKNDADGSAGMGNEWAVCTITGVSASTLTVGSITNPSHPGVLYDDGPTVRYNYVIVRPNAAQLFAVPGSGPIGREQTFLMVTPGSVLHNTLGPTTDQINADRIQNIVPPQYAANASVDRADAVYANPAPRTSLDMLGYRVVIYPDNGSGTGPDLTHPIATLNPIIDSTIPSADQRMTTDYQAGVVRFSCAPRVTDQIKPSAGCVNGVTGRLNLYAVYWAIDTALTKGNARGLWVTRSMDWLIRTPAKLDFVQGYNCWRMHSSSDGQFFYTRTQDPAETGETTATEFGVYDPTSWLYNWRYFVYRQRSNNWRFLRNMTSSTDDPSTHELDVADKTSLTVGDGANPPMGPGGDASPSPDFNWMAFRQTKDVVQELLKTACTSNYGTVHLRKGRYLFDKPLHIPPGVTLEGEGPGTTLEKISKSTPGPVIRFGPNTPWGVYDFSWSDYYYNTAPTQITLSNPYINTEGLDVVWNPTSRVWGIVYADLAAQEIWFNEMRPDGTMVYAGTGIPLKNSSTALATGGSSHTAGHYPRLAYNPYFHRYGVVWVNYSSILFNNYVQVLVFRPNSNGTFTSIRSIALGSGVLEAGDHPSIAFNLHDPTVSTVYVSFAWYASSATHIAVHAITDYADTAYSFSYGSSNPVITSTDICVTTEGNPLAVWSVHTHALIEGTNGSIDSSTPSRLYHNDVINFSTLGIQVGSKFHHLNTVAGVTEGGLDGYVHSVTSSYVEIHREDEPEVPFTAVSGLTWAISPRSLIQAGVVVSGNLYVVKVTSNTPGWTSTDFRAEMLEPDFVRVAEGNGRYLAVFQAFNATAFLARSYMRNFDNGVDMSFWDYGNINVKSQHVYREHIGTCAALINIDGNIIEPRGTDTVFDVNDIGLSTLINQQICRLPAISAKSIGAADPLVPRPNGLWFNVASLGGAGAPKSWGVKRGYHLEISARHVVHKWTASVPMSLIPDLTWTGEDWTVISPTQSQITSDTGRLVQNGGATYLVDATFYFGTGAKQGYDGNYLLETASGTVYFPTLGVSRTYTVLSEHVVLLSSSLSATNPVTWTAVHSPSSYGSATSVNVGLKNMLFRVASDGRLIQGCSRLVDTMSIGWMGDDATPTRVETVSRRKTYSQFTSSVSTGGANDPMTYGALAPWFESRFLWYGYGGWAMNYPTSRISGEIGFMGAAAGKPKGYGYHAPNEVPQAAIAWGETFFAMADRLHYGTSPTVNSIAIHRQSAGPYLSTVKQLKLQGKTIRSVNQFGGTAHLTVMSRHNVITRWGWPATGTGGFDTDGYRNCHVYPTMMASPDGDMVSVDCFLRNTGNVFFPAIIHSLAWNATYTNALGDNPIEYQGPTSAINPYNGVFSAPINDALAMDEGTDPWPDPHLMYANPSSPVVIWNGSRFVAFWTEENKLSQDTAGGLVCMGLYPGSEETYNIDSTLTIQSDLVEAIQPPMTVKISCGIGVGDSGNGPDDAIHFGQIYVCDAAFSGKVYGVVWAAGLNYNSTGSVQSGSTIGITIFTDNAGDSGASNYLIEVANTQGQLVSPKIIWDGTTFVVIWRYGNTSGVMQYAIIPETGPAQSLQVKRLTAPGTQMHDGYRTLGSIDMFGNIIVGNDPFFGPTVTPSRTASGDVQCQPGDIVHIVSINDSGHVVSGDTATSTATPPSGLIDTGLSGVVAGDHLLILDAGHTNVLKRYVVKGTLVDGGGIKLVTNFPMPNAAGVHYTVYHDTIHNEVAGWYVVKNFDPRSGTLFLTVGTAFASLEGCEVIGAIFSGGVGDSQQLLRMNNDDTDKVARAANSIVTGILYDVNNEHLGANPARIYSVVYNPQEDEIAIFYLGSDKNIYVTSFSRQNFRPRTRVTLSSGADQRVGTMAWNGRHYLLCYSPTGLDIQYYVLSPKLGIEEWGELTNHHGSSDPMTCVCGTGQGQIPGALYGTYVAPSSQTWYATTTNWGRMQARPKNMTLKWNDRMGRWVLSVGYLWCLEGKFDIGAWFFGAGQDGGIWQAYWINDGGAAENPVTSYSGRTLTGHFYVSMFQPGTRLMFWDGTHARVVMTVMDVGTRIADPSLTPTGDIYTSLTVDVNSTELTSSDRSVVISSMACFIVNREDVVVWTLATGQPAVELRDADSCSLEDVEIGGCDIDISEIYTQSAKPTWRSAGMVVGCPQAATGLQAIVQNRPYTRSFLSPVNKIETVRLSNVRSRTPVKYGTNRDPGDPGRKTCFRNRRA